MWMSKVELTWSSVLFYLFETTAYKEFAHRIYEEYKGVRLECFFDVPLSYKEVEVCCSRKRKPYSQQVIFRVQKPSSAVCGRSWLTHHCLQPNTVAIPLHRAAWWVILCMGVVISALEAKGRKKGFCLNPVESRPSDDQQFKCRLVAKHQKIGERRHGDASGSASRYSDSV